MTPPKEEREPRPAPMILWMGSPRPSAKRNRLLPSNPEVIRGRAFAALVARVEHAARLDQQQFDLPFRIGLAFYAFRNDEHFTRRHMHRAVAKIDPQLALDDQERLVGLLVIVPDEVALQLDDFELVVVHFGDHLRLPLLVEQRELLAQVDRLVAHAHLHRSRPSKFAAPQTSESDTRR